MSDVREGDNQRAQRVARILSVLLREVHEFLNADAHWQCRDMTAEDEIRASLAIITMLSSRFVAEPLQPKDNE